METAAPSSAEPRLSDTVVVGVANEPRSLPVIRLLVAAVAARIDLSLEQIDELQLAIEMVLASRVAPGATATLEIESHESALEVRLRLFGRGSPKSAGLPVGWILSTLVDTAEQITVEGKQWLRIEKHKSATAPGAG
jgi:serine/threonine-protein kinase RsbW